MCVEVEFQTNSLSTFIYQIKKKGKLKMLKFFSHCDGRQPKAFCKIDQIYFTAII